MRLYLSADIEGTCGIADWAETERATMDDYRPFAAQMTAEVAAACEGAVAAGAEDILVKDAHDSARNLDAARLPRQARVLRGWTGDPLCMMAGLERGAFGGVLFTGYHAWGCCGGNPLSHTMTTACDQVTLNGVPASEFLINAYTALYFGVPVAFLSGDRELCAFAQDWLPLPRRFAATVRYKEHKDAYRRSFYPGARLEDSKTISFDAEDWYEVLRFCHFVL